MQASYSEQIPPIVDRYFLGSLLKLKEDLKSNITLITVRTALVALMMALNNYVLVSNTQDAKSALTSYLILILIQNILQLTRQINFYYNKFKVKKEVLKMAEHFSHCLNLEDLKEVFNNQNVQDLLFFEVEPQWGLSVSICYYDFETMKKITETQQAYRNALERMGNHSIKAAMESQMGCHRYLGHVLSLYSAFLLIYGVLLNVNVPLSQFQSTFVEFYIISELVFNTKTFVLLIMIAIIPFALLVLAIYACFCRKSQKKANFPSTVLITPELMSKCSDCSICFQTFIENEKVIVLKCSQLHIFHETCIKGWGKIKPTCPICRREIE